MPSLLKPFAGYIPAKGYGHRVVGPPTSTLTSRQREDARLDPVSFRHSLGRKSRRSHAQAVEWLARWRDRGVLSEFGPAVLVYRQADDDLAATGIIADLALAAYDAGQVKPHEDTIDKTQRKMAKYVRTTRIYGNPTALAYRPDSEVNGRLEKHTERKPDTRFASADGLSHELWIVSGDEAEDLCEGIDTPLYITDGHHRLAAASAVAAEEKRRKARIPVGLFSADELRVSAFARCITDPSIKAKAVVARLQSEHNLVEVAEADARPRQRNEFGIRIKGRHFRLELDRQAIPDDLYAALDVNLLQDLILDPLFGIADEAKDKRLSFVADTPESKIDGSKADVWILPFPAAVADVMAVANSGRVMPPKSTLFTPKLPSGLVIRLLDED
ncbi:MAG: DUF1015 family protein [Acidimicrobiia bacterium]|nr:DUF1015 family protein [Acidimicrobiia bacterium]